MLHLSSYVVVHTIIMNIGRRTQQNVDIILLFVIKVVVIIVVLGGTHESTADKAWKEEGGVQLIVVHHSVPCNRKAHFSSLRKPFAEIYVNQF